MKKWKEMPTHSIAESNRLSSKGIPNSSIDILNPDGSVKRRRYYDENGNAKLDIDYNHTDDGTHEFPHTHTWDWTDPDKPKRLQ